MSMLRLHRIWRQWEGPPEPAVESSVVRLTDDSPPCDPPALRGCLGPWVPTGGGDGVGGEVRDGGVGARRPRRDSHPHPVAGGGARVGPGPGAVQHEAC